MWPRRAQAYLWLLLKYTPPGVQAHGARSDGRAHGPTQGTRQSGGRGGGSGSTGGVAEGSQAHGAGGAAAETA